MGKVYIVGAGPGDPELLTLRAHRLLSDADVILYDALVGREILNIAKPNCLKVYVGKRDGRHSISQEEINELLYKFSRVYDKVVRLKGGDPFIFGRGGEELLYLKSMGVEVEVVPGVSSALSAPASANIPLTHRGVSSSVAIVNGHPNREIDWSSFRGIDTLVVLMGVKNRQKIALQLLNSGRDPNEPVAFVEKATTPEERVIFTNLLELSREPPQVNTPAVMIIGPVVRVGEELRSLLGTTLSA